MLIVPETQSDIFSADLVADWAEIAELGQVVKDAVRA